VKDFIFSAKKKNYFLFLGRVNSGKGIHIAKQIAAATNTKLIVAGAGDIPNRKDRRAEKLVEYVGVVGPAERAKLLSKARATLCPSTFLEPFCGVQIESMLSGTPVISSDWGAFAEYNLHGSTGFRCKTFEQFVWAANHLEGFTSANACRAQGVRFAMNCIAPRYEDYFASVKDVFGGKGWYAERPKRKTLFNSSWG